MRRPTLPSPNKAILVMYVPTTQCPWPTPKCPHLAQAGVLLHRPLGHLGAAHKGEDAWGKMEGERCGLAGVGAYSKVQDACDSITPPRPMLHEVMRL